MGIAARIVDSGAKVDKNLIFGVGREYKSVGRDAIFPKYHTDMTVVLLLVLLVCRPHSYS